jgi:hypothetical protein
LGGTGLYIYIPQEQSGPVIPPGIEFPCRRLLRLAGVRRRYSNPPPHGTKPLLGTSHIFPYLFIVNAKEIMYDRIIG